MLCAFSFILLSAHVASAPAQTSTPEPALLTAGQNVTAQTVYKIAETHSSEQEPVVGRASRTVEDSFFIQTPNAKLKADNQSQTEIKTTFPSHLSKSIVNGQGNDSTPIPTDASQGELKGNGAGADSGRSESYSSVEMDISLESDDDLVLVKWTFPSNLTEVTGFIVTYDNEDTQESFDSSKLNTQVRSLVLHSPHKEDKYEVCVKALVNTTVVKMACTVLDPEASTGKIITGVLAGVVFLIPCVAVLIWILRKDKAVKNESLDDEDLISKESLIEKDEVSSKTQGKKENCEDSQKRQRRVVVATSERPEKIVPRTDKKSPTTSQKQLPPDKGHDNPAMAFNKEDPPTVTLVSVTAASANITTITRL